MPYIDYYTNLYIIYQQKRIRPSSDWINGYLTILMGGGDQIRLPFETIRNRDIYQREIPGFKMSKRKNQSTYSSWWFRPMWKILVKLDHLVSPSIVSNTPPKFNSSPLKSDHPKTRAIFQPSFFQGVCSCWLSACPVKQSAFSFNLYISNSK